MGDRAPGPSVVWLIRHGESMGNVADAEAQAAGAGRLELDIRDPDVPLSDTGRSQAEALGRHLAGLLRLGVGDVAHALAVPDEPHHRRARSPIAHAAPVRTAPCGSPDAGSRARSHRNRHLPEGG